MDKIKRKAQQTNNYLEVCIQDEHKTFWITIQANPIAMPSVSNLNKFLQNELTADQTVIGFCMTDEINPDTENRTDLTFGNSIKTNLF